MLPVVLPNPAPELCKKRDAIFYPFLVCLLACRVDLLFCVCYFCVFVLCVRSAPKSLSTQEESACRSTTSVRPTRTSEAPTAAQMASCPCCACSTTPPATSTRWVIVAMVGEGGGGAGTHGTGEVYRPFSEAFHLRRSSVPPKHKNGEKWNVRRNEHCKTRLTE